MAEALNPRRAVLVTGHYALSKRRAGFHWIADALWRSGWDVTFLTAPFTHLHRLKRDHRFGYGLLSQAGRPIQIRDRFTSFVWFTPWHPPNRLPSIVNWLADPVFQRYGREVPQGALELIRAADLVIFESTAGLMLFEAVKRLNPTARCVYRMSDDLRLLRAPKAMRDVEERNASRFDLISVSSDYSYQKFATLGNTRLHFHGVEKAVFDEPHPSPFEHPAACNVVWIGVARLDRDFVDRAARMFPEWRFHIVGPFTSVSGSPNVVQYGERPFYETVPFLQHADIGLHTITRTPNAEHLADSLKVIQFTYCGKPIVAPEFLGSKRLNVFTYRPSDSASIRYALERAAAFESATVDIGRDAIRSWDELALELAGEPFRP